MNEIESLLQLGVADADAVLCKHIVRIKHHQYISRCVPDSHVLGMRIATVLLKTDVLDPLPEIWLDDLLGIVCRGVIHDDHLGIAEVLPKERLDAVADILSVVEQSCDH